MDPIESSLTKHKKEEEEDENDPHGDQHRSCLYLFLNQRTKHAHRSIRHSSIRTLDEWNHSILHGYERFRWRRIARVQLDRRTRINGRFFDCSTIREGRLPRIVLSLLYSPLAFERISVPKLKSSTVSLNSSQNNRHF